MLYESMQARLSKRDSAFSSTGSSPLTHSGVKKKSHFLSNRAGATESSQHLLELQDDSEISSPDHAHVFRGNGKARARSRDESNISLEQKVDELNEKIERLTALITAQQYKSSGAPDDVQYT
jgi:hypothetical protein